MPLQPAKDSLRPWHHHIQILVLTLMLTFPLPNKPWFTTISTNQSAFLIMAPIRRKNSGKKKAIFISAHTHTYIHMYYVCVCVHIHTFCLASILFQQEAWLHECAKLFLLSSGIFLILSSRKSESLSINFHGICTNFLHRQLIFLAQPFSSIPRICIHLLVWK